MVGALDHTAAAIEELVCDPFEWNANMRTAIVVEINFIQLFDRKQLAPGQIKTPAATFGNLSKGAKAQLTR